MARKDATKSSDSSNESQPSATVSNVKFYTLKQFRD